MSSTKGLIIIITRDTLYQIANLARDVPLLLAQPNYRVLAYYGKEDFICNWIGGEAWVTQLRWPGQVRPPVVAFIEDLIFF